MQIKDDWSLVRIIRSDCDVMLSAENSIPPEQAENPGVSLSLSKKLLQ
jgi:hypothetical protein